VTSTESYTAVADQARTAIERSARIWQQSTQQLSDQVDVVTQLPQVDLSTAVRRYFQYLEDGFEVNRNLVQRWVEFGWSSLDELSRIGLESMTGFARGHGEAISTWISDETELAGNAVQEQAQEAERVRTEQVREQRATERKEAREAHRQARERYEGLTKAELADQLSDRDLPKTGTVEELIERLVSADSQG
jgi:hypothetical protein